MTRRALYFLAPSALILCLLAGSLLDTKARESEIHEPQVLPLRWPIEVGVASFVTQSPGESAQPYPCGSGVNGRHILHDKLGFNQDYLESLDIVVHRTDVAMARSEGRGTDVVAVASGRVVATNMSQTECDRSVGAGNYLIIEHDQVLRDGKPLRSAYMHLNSFQSSEEEFSCGTNPEPSSLMTFHPLAVGSRVQAGQKIGEVGNTGNSTGPHLHFQFATDCVLEPSTSVNCPALGLLTVNPSGFDNIATRRDESCPAQGVGGPGPSAAPSADIYLMDGTFVTGQAPARAMPDDIATP